MLKWLFLDYEKSSGLAHSLTSERLQQKKLQEFLDFRPQMREFTNTRKKQQNKERNLED